jgi:large subunit ribosomal protein L20
MAKGFRGSGSTLYRTARERVERSLCMAYVGRKLRKRDMRKLWIQRINAAARLNGLSYSRLIHGLSLAGVALNRKVLADLAVYDAAAFAKVVETAKAKVS